jgi:hypothetical protein
MRCDACGGRKVKLREPKPVATLGFRYRCVGCGRTVQEMLKGTQRYVPIHEARRPEKED